MLEEAACRRGAVGFSLTIGGVFPRYTYCHVFVLYLSRICIIHVFEVYFTRIYINTAPPNAAMCIMLYLRVFDLYLGVFVPGPDIAKYVQ